MFGKANAAPVKATTSSGTQTTKPDDLVHRQVERERARARGGSANAVAHRRTPGQYQR